jgi:hypothetical protein
VVVQSIDNAGFFSVGIILVLLMDRLHEFVQLADLLICIQSACVKCDSLGMFTHHSFYQSCPYPSFGLSKNHPGGFGRTIAILKGSQSADAY